MSFWRVNKIDLVGYDADVFDRHRGRVPRLRQDARLRDAGGDPGVGAQGRQYPHAVRRRCPGIAGRSWCPISRPSRWRPTGPAKPMRFPVQWVNRPDLDFRGFSGTVASGIVTGRRRRAGRGVAQAREDHAHRHHGWRADEAIAGRGGDAGARPRSRYLARRCADASGPDARVLEPVPGARGLDERRAGAARPLLSAARSAARLVPATITDLKFRTNVNTLEESAAKTLELNEVGTLTIATDEADCVRLPMPATARPARSS